jgi:hypothetical protein
MNLNNKGILWDNLFADISQIFYWFIGMTFEWNTKHTLFILPDLSVARLTD